MAKRQSYIGLSSSEVTASRRLHGSNVISEPQREPLWRKFLAKFTDPLIRILLVAGALSIGISAYEYFVMDKPTSVFFEPVGIFIAIILATGLAFFFEQRAESEFNLLNKVSDNDPVRVYRDGRMVKISKSDVVVGDVVMIDTGDEIPADGTLMEASQLMVDESSLTGEPVSEKAATQDVDAYGSETSIESSDEATYPRWQVLRGTKVMEGHGVFKVTAVGDSTENGQAFTATLLDDHVKTPLNEQLDRLGLFIARASYVIASLVVVGRIADYLITEDFSTFDFLLYLLQTIMIAVTLIVVAVPEGLPMAVTLSLAYSMRRMLKNNNLVRKMHACETMGAATVICTDKTGTLTQNKMVVSEVFVPTAMSADDSEQSLIANMAINSTAQLNGQEVIGNPTEGALLLWIDGKGMDYKLLRANADIVDETPFSTERKYMSTTVKTNSGTVTYIKGAPEIVMDMCSMKQEERCGYLEKLALYQHKAMRTLAFAMQVDNGAFVMQAVAAISDPVRPEVKAAVEECVNAGIDVKIVTGDTPGTAIEIGRQIGLIDDSLPSELFFKPDTDESKMVITGSQFQELSDEQLKERVGRLKIIARARPMDKKRLVEALQSNGEVVAVTGDGTNDAPALHTAHVGLSMGDGTAVAKEASDITIIDNSFSSIGLAVMWGRSLYRNIQRFILFQMTVNVVACITVLVGAFFDTRSSLTVTQMLWVNLIMDTFAAMALASLPPSPSVMKEHPRDRKDFIISTPMREFIIIVGGLFSAVLLAMYFFFEKGGFSSHEQCLFFTIFVMMQFWNILNAKAFLTGRNAFHDISHSKGFNIIALLIFFGQIVIVEFGGELFSVEPLSIVEWVTIVSLTSLIWIGGELFRFIKHYIYHRK
jgi:Ca2+-transporting ATPase